MINITIFKLMLTEKLDFGSLANVTTNDTDH